jgi:DNA-binding XRE family transcriptional regulator
MKKPRYTEQQIAQALREAEQGTPAAELCRKLGVSETTFYAWEKKYLGHQPERATPSSLARTGNPVVSENCARAQAARW